MSTWTYQTQLSTSDNNVQDLVTDHGTTIAVCFNNVHLTNDYYRSTNGGVSWTLVSSGNLADSGGALVYAGSSIWLYLGQHPGTSYKSTNDGVTWASFADALSFGVSGTTTDGNGTIIAGPASAVNTVEATVNGNSPLTAFSAPTDFAALVKGGILYDGTQFVAISIYNSSSNQAVWTAPTGFTISAGPTWTQQGSSITGTRFPGTNGLSQARSLFYISGIGYVALGPTSTYPQYIVASSPSTLPTVSPTNFTSEGTAGSGAILRNLRCASSVVFAMTGAGNIWRSFDGSTWSQDTMSQAFASGEYGECVVYDSVNQAFILIGTSTSVFTAAPLIEVSPTTATVAGGGQVQFSEVTSPSGTAVTWSCLYGTITAGGLYTAPVSGHASDTVTVQWQSDSAISASAAVTITADSITVSPHSVSVPYGSSTLFSITTNPAGLAATWSVNGLIGGDSVHGTVVNGYYVAPALPNGITSVTVTATRQDIPTLSDSATVTLTTPTIGGGSTGGIPGGTAYITGKFRGPKVFPAVVLAKAATIPLRIYEPEENKTFKG